MTETQQCRQCGKRLEDDARFCSQCGAPQTGTPAVQARVDGSGAAAQLGGVAAGAGGAAVGKDVRGDAVMGGKATTFDLREQRVEQQFNVAGNLVQGTPGSDPMSLRRAYLQELARATNRLPWTNVAQDYADPESGEGLGLAEVYTHLDTTTLERVGCEEELRQFMACLERGEAKRTPAQALIEREKRLLILGDPVTL